MLGESVHVSPSRPPQLSHLPSPVAPPRTTPGAGPSGSAPVDADDGPPASRTRDTVQDARRNEKLSSLEVSKLGTGLSRELDERTLFRSKFRKRNSCPTPLYFETNFEKCSERPSRGGPHLTNPPPLVVFVARSSAHAGSCVAPPKGAPHNQTDPAPRGVDLFWCPRHRCLPPRLSKMQAPVAPCSSGRSAFKQMHLTALAWCLVKAQTTPSTTALRVLHDGQLLLFLLLHREKPADANSR